MFWNDLQYLEAPTLISISVVRSIHLERKKTDPDCQEDLVIRLIIEEKSITEPRGDVDTESELHTNYKTYS